MSLGKSFSVLSMLAEKGSLVNAKLMINELRGSTEGDIDNPAT